jgi:hypothetical protein
MTSFTTYVTIAVREIKLLLQKGKPSKSNQNGRESTIFQADCCNTAPERDELVEADNLGASNEQAGFTVKFIASILKVYNSNFSWDTN